MENIAFAKIFKLIIFISKSNHVSILFQMLINVVSISADQHKTT